MSYRPISIFQPGKLHKLKEITLGYDDDTDEFILTFARQADPYGNVSHEEIYDGHDDVAVGWKTLVRILGEVIMSREGE